MEQSSALPDFNPLVSESRQGTGGHGREVKEDRMVKGQVGGFAWWARAVALSPQVWTYVDTLTA